MLKPKPFTPLSGQYVASYPGPNHGICCWVRKSPGVASDTSGTSAKMPSCVTRRRVSESAVAGSFLSSANSVHWNLYPLTSLVSLARWKRACAPIAASPKLATYPMPPTLIVPLVTVTAAGVDAPLTAGVSHAATRHITVATSTSPAPRFLLAVMVPPWSRPRTRPFGDVYTNLVSSRVHLATTAYGPRPEPARRPRCSVERRKAPLDHASITLATPSDWAASYSIVLVAARAAF